MVFNGGGAGRWCLMVVVLGYGSDCGSDNSF